MTWFICQSEPPACPDLVLTFVNAGRLFYKRHALLKITIYFNIYFSIYRNHDSFSGACEKFRLHCNIYCYEFVSIVCKICKYYLFLHYNISDALKIFIFSEKIRKFS